MAMSLSDIINKGKQQSQGNKQRTVKPKPGKSVWRILPGWNPKEPNLFFHSYGQHFLKDQHGKIKAVITCRAMTHDEDCEVCNAIRDAAQSAPTDKEREKINDMRSSRRFLMNAIDVDSDPNKVVILEVGMGLFRDILANIEEDESLIDAAQGRDFVISREGTALNTRYSLAVRSKAKSSTVNKSILMELNDLSEYVEEDYEASVKKALGVLGAATGHIAAGSSAAGALAAPDMDLDDELPDFSEEDARAAAAKEIKDSEVEDAVLLDEEPTEDEAPVEAPAEDKAKAEDTYGADISDDDIEQMLADL